MKLQKRLKQIFDEALFNREIESYIDRFPGMENLIRNSVRMLEEAAANAIPKATISCAAVQPSIFLESFLTRQGLTVERIDELKIKVSGYT